MKSMISPLVSTGMEKSSSIAVTRLFHTNSGMRISVMPGARSLKIVAMKLIAPRMELVPSRISPTSSRSTPTSGDVAG